MAKKHKAKKRAKLDPDELERKWRHLLRDLLQAAQILDASPKTLACIDKGNGKRPDEWLEGFRERAPKLRETLRQFILYTEEADRRVAIAAAKNGRKPRPSGEVVPYIPRRMGGLIETLVNSARSQVEPVAT